MLRDKSALPTVLRKKLPKNLEKIRGGHYTKDDWDYPIHLYLRENDIRVDETGSEIIDFLRGKSILVTGATGFLEVLKLCIMKDRQRTEFVGKLLVEKLLRCCEGIDKIYIIVRTKKGKDPETRVKEYLDNWVFVKLSEIYPTFRDKVVGICGDFEEDGLGLSEESRKFLTEKINIIYHIAATVRFDEKLKKAVKVNIIGTREIIKLAKECQKLEVLTHVSTAYSNCIYKEIKEQFYTPLMTPQEIIKITRELSSEIVDRMTLGLLGEAPNTYAFTKQIAEDVVRTDSVGLPVCIQRPSIILTTAREPIRSWIDNIFGPVGLIEGAVLGLFHVMLGNPNGKCDLVPADYTINNCIAASYNTAKDRNTDKVQIFNFTSLDSNPFYWKNIGFAGKEVINVGSTKQSSKFFFRITKYWYWYMFLSFILHTIPGYIFDFVAVRLGKEPRLTKIYFKINKFVDVFSYFTLNEWTFDSTNTRNLWYSLNDKDKQIFAFDMKTLNWNEYFDTYLAAMREFLRFEYLDNLEQGRTHQKRIDLTCNVAIVTIVALSIYFCLNTVFVFIPVTIVGIILYYYFTDAY